MELKPNHAKLQSSDKYRAIGGFDMTRAEAREMLTASGGAAVLDSSLASHEHMKKGDWVSHLLSLRLMDSLILSAYHFPPMKEQRKLRLA